MDIPTESDRLINTIEARAAEFALDNFGGCHKILVLAIESAMLIGAIIMLEQQNEQERASRTSS